MRCFPFGLSFHRPAFVSCYLRFLCQCLLLSHQLLHIATVCRVVQAPWRLPGADPADFFNYGLNINTWKEYVGRIHQFRLEFTMQKQIQTYESSNDAPALDPDLPPELAAAVAQGRQKASQRQVTQDVNWTMCAVSHEWPSSLKMSQKLSGHMTIFLITFCRIGLMCCCLLALCDVHAKL